MCVCIYNLYIYIYIYNYPFKAPVSGGTIPKCKMHFLAHLIPFLQCKIGRSTFPQVSFLYVFVRGKYLEHDIDI